MASQATDNRIGLFQFRPQIWFQRSGLDEASGIGFYIPAEFAVAPDDHSFAVEIGGAGEGLGISSESLVGGSGRPDA